MRKAAQNDARLTAARALGRENRDKFDAEARAAAAEFDALLSGVPSVMIQPLGRDGLVVLGGWAPRCFSNSDQAWLQGWAERLKDEWLLQESPPLGSMAAASGSSAPLNQEL